MADYAIYSDVNDAPKPWRSIGGVRLSVEQLNGIMKRSVELGSDTEPDYTSAREEFRNSNKVMDGLWVPMTDEEKQARQNELSMEQQVNDTFKDGDE